MVNIIFSTNIILGIICIIGSFLVQFVGIVEPQIVDEKDGILIGSLFVSGVILIIHGWRLDPILIFVQELLILMSGLVIYEMMRGRYINIVLCKKLNQDDLDFSEPKEK